MCLIVLFQCKYSNVTTVPKFAVSESEPLSTDLTFDKNDAAWLEKFGSSTQYVTTLTMARQNSTDILSQSVPKGCSIFGR